MRCKRCGAVIPPRMGRCPRCGTAYKDHSRNNELLIVVTIIVLSAILVAMTASFMINKFSVRKRPSFGGGGGGGAVSALPVPGGPVPGGSGLIVPKPTPKPTPTPTKTPNPTPSASATPAKTQSPGDLEERKRMKKEFEQEAKSIEEYTRKNLETATTTIQKNNESTIVFEKWDVLLNKIYDYLETIMPEDEFAELAEDELKWIIEKENAIRAAKENSRGTEDEFYAPNMVGIFYTIDRCNYLMSLII